MSIAERGASLTGYVMKRGGRIKVWRKKFMVTTAEGLVYFKNKDDFSKQVISGTLVFDKMCPLPKSNKVAEELSFLSAGRHFAFRVMTGSRPRYFCTDSAELTRKWVRSINLGFHAWSNNNGGSAQFLIRAQSSIRNR